MTIISKIKEELPNKAIEDIVYEGANIIVYTKDMKFLDKGKSKIKDIVDKVKKRIELRPDPTMLLDIEEAEEIIRKIVPKTAELGDIWFDYNRSIVYLESGKPGVVIGRNGRIIEEIKKKTRWVPIIKRSPAIKSDLVRSIRATLYKNSEYRRNFMHKIGEKIYQPYTKNKHYWIRLSFLGGAREVGRSAILLQTPNSRVLMDCGVNVASEINAYPKLEAPEFNIKELDAIVITHAHLDHSGFVPYLFKYGYRGPVYCTEPTRDIMTMLQLDYIDVMRKDGKEQIYSSTDIYEMIKHTVTFDYDEVNDITKDVRLTLHNAGHVLGSAMVHLNIGDGYHNMLYTGDFKYTNTRLLNKAHDTFQRLETIVMESTYSGPDDIQPKREESEKKFLDIIKATIEKEGKVLVPVLGVGRSQEIMLILEEAMNKGKIPKVPIIIDGMVWDVNAIHTTYPEFMNKKVKKDIFHKDHNPFLSDIFKRVVSNKDRDKITEEGGPTIITATSGMLTGGPSVYYLYKLAEDPRNALIFVSYQGEGSLGRKIQEGEKEVPVSVEGKSKIVKIKLNVYTIDGFSGHADRNELLNYLKKVTPKPKRAIFVHGEKSKSTKFSSVVHKTFSIETSTPRILDALRIR
ncbi:beta-CASP ribonuclease aCPSF1 [Nanoarchaeota archaeon]|nr:MAG: beta-CASP ribonuclease aCPSF1 [Nanoarchaeota archaeon]